jgi:hypothetical protein
MLDSSNSLERPKRGQQGRTDLPSKGRGWPTETIEYNLSKELNQIIAFSKKRNIMFLPQQGMTYIVRYADVSIDGTSYKNNYTFRYIIQVIISNWPRLKRNNQKWSPQVTQVWVLSFLQDEFQNAAANVKWSSIDGHAKLPGPHFNKNCWDSKLAGVNGLHMVLHGLAGSSDCRGVDGWMVTATPN